MTRLISASALFILIIVVSAGVLIVRRTTSSQTVAPPAAVATQASAIPAFLDADNSVTIWMKDSVAASSLLNHVSVRCGSDMVPVKSVEAVQEDDAASEVVLVGTVQSALGGSDWSPDDPHTRMVQVSPGVFEYQGTLAKGSYHYKIARGGSWTENWGADFKPGGSNITLDIPADNTAVLFQADFNAHTIRTSVDTPSLTPSPTPLVPTASHLFHLILSSNLGPTQIVQPLMVRFIDGSARPIYDREVLTEPKYTYNSDDLGATYTHTGTTFKVWSPVSSAAQLLLYHDSTSAAYKTVALSQNAEGVWSVSVNGDLNGVYYQYAFMSYGALHIAPDLYGRAASADLRRSMVVDLSRTDPTGWSTVASPTLAQPTDAVVYETHIRDFTIDPSSGVPAALRGKYEGLIAKGTTVPGTNLPTGLDYLRRLGVNYVHLLPFQSINPAHPSYNWGYETYLFDVPEPRYATNPADPAGVIREVKTMVAGLHKAGLGLVMDVVYNHTLPTSGDASPFWATVPYYYFRTDSQGQLQDDSGVGNAMDDERPMVRKYISDSLAYWLTQYHVDGFRFDLLGMYSPATVAEISQKLHSLRPDILLYGEPWTGGGPLRFGKGAQRGLGVAVFNDNIRNLIRGDLNGTTRGFALGGGADMAKLQTAISGSPDFTQAPTESMNYVSIHDDHTLWDKITKALPGDDAMDRRALKLAGAMVLLSQGVPILEGGAELGRTKQGQSNSFDLGDSINQFDWKRGQQFDDISDYYRGLIAIRRAHPAFRNYTAAGVAATLSILPTSNLPAQTTAFTLDGTPTHDSWSKTLVIFHGETKSNTITLPAGSWHLAVDGDKAQLQGDLITASTLTLMPLSTYVLYQ